MAKQRAIDSHIHLWPPETCNSQGHAWMTEGNPLATPHLLADYLKAAGQTDHSSDVEVEGVVYVETDVRYDPPTSSEDVAVWAKGPLDEIGFVRRIVDGEYGDRESNLLLGAVMWAPLSQSPQKFKEYLRFGEERAGPDCWALIKGFRFLLQFITDQGEFERLVLGDNFQSNLKELGRRKFSFDVGVDQRSGGIWQLELVAQAMERAHEGVAEDDKVIFVLDHLCKPAFAESGASFDRWAAAIGRMAKLSKTYIKLSGAFSELPSDLSRVDEIASYMRPWVEHVIQQFGPQRVMFGSDWPVCNVSGPSKGGSWVDWKQVVVSLLSDDSHRLSPPMQERIWRTTARAAYRLSRG
jgi:L-rhamnono-1,4-lactonase